MERLAQRRPITIVSEQQMLELGLEACRFDTTTTNLNTDLQRFRDLFGGSPKATAELFRDLQTQDLGDVSIKKISVKNLFMALYYARSYGIETRVMIVFGKKCAKNFRMHVWQYLKAIQALKAKKIVWCFDDAHPPGPNSAKLFATIDGVHCRIYEPRHNPSSKWYSHKFRGPAVTYELVVNVRTDNLISIRGPFHAGTPDGQMAQMPDGILDMIPDGFKIIGDNAYRGVPEKFSAPNPHDTKNVASFKGRARARHETFNKRIKDYQIINQQFRNKLAKHKIAFEAVCVLVQYNIENGNGLFEI